MPAAIPSLIAALVLGACSTEPPAASSGPAASPASAGSPAPASPAPAAAPAPAGPVDAIVVVVIDTLRADHLGLYGYERPTSPRIDAWAAEGAVFDRAYAHSGWTLASFTSLLTGLLPHEHRVGRSPLDPTCFGSLPAEVETLPEKLQAAGWSTGAYINNTFLAPQFGLNQGFSQWSWHGSSPTEIRSAADTVDQALGWLDGQQGPAFLLLHFMEPHMVYDPPAPFKGTFSDATPVSPEESIQTSTFRKWQAGEALPTPAQKARAIALYDEEILASDAAFGQLLDGLSARGRLDRSLVVLTADHGEEFWEHGRYEHGHSLLGELTRVPLVAVGPGVAPGRVRTVVSHSDLYRGLLSQAKLPAPAGGDLFALAGLGPYAGPRQAVMENTLYGPPRTGIVDDELRLDVEQDLKLLSLWQVDTAGGETGPLVGADVSQRARPLHAALLGLRGNLDADPEVAGASEGCGANIPSYEVFKQLETLGYLEDR